MSPETNQGAKSQIVRGVLTGLLVTFLLLFLKLGFEHSTLYEGLRRATYSWLLSRLQPPRRRADLPIVILDIRDLEYSSFEVEGKKFPYTQREPLIALIKAVVAQKPAAIGVDIDFSPLEVGPADPKDSTHFRELMSLSRESGVPIFLGINRSQYRTKGKWLLTPEFESLAVNIDKPKDNRKMFAWTGTEEGGRGPTMCQALAKVVNPSAGDELRGVSSWVVSQISPGVTTHNLPAGEFLVDFSALDALRDTRLKTKNPEVVKDQGWTLEKKVVLIGDGTLYTGQDTVIVPLSHENDPVPGIYLHANAAYTLTKAPLYELTWLGRLLADVALACVVLAGVAAARVYVQSWGKKFAELRAAYFFVLVITVVSIVLGVLFLNYTRVIWDDLIFVLIALWIHPLVENNLWAGLSWLRTKIPLLFKRMFSEEAA